MKAKLLVCILILTLIFPLTVFAAEPPAPQIEVFPTMVAPTLPPELIGLSATTTSDGQIRVEWDNTLPTQPDAFALNFAQVDFCIFGEPSNPCAMTAWISEGMTASNFVVQKPYPAGLYFFWVEPIYFGQPNRPMYGPVAAQSWTVELSGYLQATIRFWGDPALYDEVEVYFATDCVDVPGEPAEACITEHILPNGNEGYEYVLKHDVASGWHRIELGFVSKTGAVVFLGQQHIEVNHTFLPFMR